ncbi:hypothetical protein Goari_013281 [Gossypium aridum]|uniref:Uncharacterized protein n=1 Tax=Gossypium aridum TaxID=34290 RepID=A0A7J8XE79_GOSAI|nr:hypothetical protein [Gossypium aridum]
MDASRPSLGFPLGTALLLIIIFSLSGFFSCCYHWGKFRSLRRSFTDAAAVPDDDTEASPSKPRPNCMVKLFPQQHDKFSRFKEKPERKLACFNAWR